MRIKRYFLLTTEYPPFYGGGIATYSYHTAKMLSERGIEVTVITSEKNLEMDAVIEDRNLKIFRFKQEGELYNYLGEFLGLSYQISEVVKKLIEKEGPPEIIDCQDYLGIGYYLLQRKYALEKPFRDLKVLITLHAPRFICDLYNEAPAYKFPDYTIGEAEKWCIKSADAVISPSEYLKKELKRFSELKDVKIEIIRNPYQIERTDFSSGNKEDLVFVGRLEKRKGIPELIEFMKHIWDEGWKIPLYLIGGETWFHAKGKWMGEWLKEKYKNYFNEGFIIHLGIISPEELKERLSKRAKIGVVPSLFENFPYVVIEFIENGVIPIVSDRGGMKELLGEKSLVFSLDDFKSFKEKLLYVVKAKEDELKDLKEYYLERVQKLCGYDVIFKSKMDYLERVLEGGKRKFYPFLREYKTYKDSEEDSVFAEEKGLLSIVIPYHNLGELVLETIKSIDESTYPYKEIIIVNDASTDPKSLEVLKELEEKRKDIRIIHKERNEGLALARNTGALTARGEYLAFVDADDLVYPEYFSKAIEILKTYENVSFVGCFLEYFGGSSGIWITFNPEFPYILFHNSINSQGLVIRRRDFLNFGLNDPKMKYGMEDYDMVINLLKHGKRGVVIPEVLFKYRVRKESMLRQFNPHTYLYLYKLLTEKHSDLYQHFGTELFNLQNANGSAFMIDSPGGESFLWQDVLSGKMERLAGELEISKKELETLRKELEMSRKELEMLREEKERYREQLERIYRSRGWKVLSFYYKIKHWTLSKLGLIKG